MAVTIAALVRGSVTQHQEVADAVARARALASRGRPGPNKLETLGRGWVAEEALAIAVCCSLTATDFADGVILAANHSGDSDSTAAITGNVLGVLFGEGAIPTAWLNNLERGHEIAQLADDLYAITIGALRAETIWDRYPGS